MRSTGSRRARGISLACVLLVAFGLWRAAQLYVRGVLRHIGPTLVARAEAASGREIRVRRLVIDQPGHVLLEGVRVAREERLQDGELVSVGSLEITYDPDLLSIGSLISRALGRKTTAHVEARDVRFPQPQSGLMGDLLTMRSLSTDFDLGPLLRGSGDVVQTIERVELGGASIHIVRSTDMHWSYEPLFRRKKAAKPPTFRGAIHAPGLSVDLVDYHSGVLPAPVLNRAAADCTVRFGSFPDVQFDATGKMAGAERTPFDVVGRVNPKARQWSFTFRGSTRRMAYWYQYLSPQNSAVDVLGGQANAEITVWDVPVLRDIRLHKTGFALSLDVRDGAIRLAALNRPLRRFVGKVLVNPGVLAFDGEAAAGGVAGQISGEVRFAKEPISRFRVRSPEVSVYALKELFPAIPLPHDLNVPVPPKADLVVTGRPGLWTVQGTTEFSGFTFQKLRMDGVKSRFQLLLAPDQPPVVSGTFTADGARLVDGNAAEVRGDFRVRDRLAQISADFQTMGGNARASGWIDTIPDPWHFYLHGQAQGLDAARIAWSPDERIRLAGRVTSDFVASGSVEAPVVSAYVRAAPLAVNEESVEEVTGRVRYEDGVYRIPYLTVNDSRLTAAVSGTVAADGRMDLRAAVRGVDLARVLAARTEEPVSGTAFLLGAVKGTLRAPEVEGKLQIYQPFFHGYSADYLAAGLQVQGSDTVRLSDLSVIRNLTHVSAPKVSLTRSTNTDWNVDGSFSVAGLSITRALLLAGMREDALLKQPFSGDLDTARVTLHGPLASPSVAFELTGREVAYSGLDLGQVRLGGSLDLNNGRVNVEHLSVASGLLSGSGSGSVTFDPKVVPEKRLEGAVADLRFTISDVRLPPLLRRYEPALLDYVTLEGRLAHFDGKLKGTFDAPDLTGIVQLSGLILDKRAIALEPVRMEWSREGFLAQDIQGRVGSGEVRIPYVAGLLAADGTGATALSANPADRWIGQVALLHVPVVVARQLVEDSPYYQTEAFQGLREALAQWRSPVVGTVEASLGIGGIGGIGGIDGGESGATPPASLAEALARIRGRTGGARIALRIEIPNLVSPPNPEAAPTQFAARGWFQAGHLHLDELRLQQERGALLVVSGDRSKPAGTLGPVAAPGAAAEMGADQSPGGTLKFAARASGFHLSSLARLPISGLRERVEMLQPVDGELTAQAEIGGTDRKPSARFSVTVLHPVLRGVPFDELSIQQADYSGENGVLRMDSARIVKNVSAASGGAAGSPPDARTIRLTGSLPLTWPDLLSPRTAERHLTVEIPRQSLTVLSALAADTETRAASADAETQERVRPITGLLRQVASTQGEMESKITLGGSAIRPENQGFLAITGGRLHLASLDTEVRDFNARLDLDGDLVRVTRLEGKSSRGGGFQGGGQVRLGQDTNGGALAHLNLTFGIDGFQFVEKKVSRLVGAAFAGSQIQGTLRTVNPAAPDRSQPLTISGDWPSPTVSGALELDDASLVLAYEEVAEQTGTVLGEDVRLNVLLLAGKNVWLRNPGARLQLSESARITNTLEAPAVHGELHVAHGTFSLSGLRLRNGEGSIRINYEAQQNSFGVPAPPPLFVDITAVTSFRVQRSASQEAEYYDATFEIKGAPGGESVATGPSVGTAGGLTVGGEGGLKLTVRTDPPLPSQDIEAVIRQQLGVEGFSPAGANTVEALRGQIEQVFAVNVGSAVTGPIEDIVQKTFGLNTVSLDLGATQPLLVRIGKRLFGPFYGTFTQEVGGVQNQWSFETYYRINSQLRVGYRQEEPFERQVIFFSTVRSF